jgi:hypothetical protein
MKGKLEQIEDIFWAVQPTTFPAAKSISLSYLIRHIFNMLQAGD